MQTRQHLLPGLYFFVIRPLFISPVLCYPFLRKLPTAPRKELFMSFLYVLMTLAALAFPFFMINAIVYHMKEDARAIKYTIYACILFAVVVWLIRLVVWY